MVITQNIKKKLTRNDIGANGSHQGGILIPKDSEILSFFPSLENNARNPRKTITFIDENEISWRFNFIYYNSRSFNGTRNEFRLTGMTHFLRSNELCAGDELIFMKDEFERRHIKFRHVTKASEVSGNVIRLSSNWTVINLKEK